MAPPARPWFRFYVEAVHDRKLRRVTPAERWLWVSILAAARQSCLPGYLLVSEREPMDEHDLADFAGMTPREVARAIPKFEVSGMLEHDHDLKCWWVPKFADRQYESDVSTERVKKHRSKHVDGTGMKRYINGDETVTPSEGETPPETETDTETETEKPGFMLKTNISSRVPVTDLWISHD